MAEVLKQPAPDRPNISFPDDVLIEILSRLPVRPLLLFRSVSKHWLNLIQTPIFINLHTNRPIYNYNDHNPVLILRTVNTESPRINGISPPIINRKLVLTLLSDSETLAYRDELPLEVVSPSIATRGFESNLDLLGPCNGVFCVTDVIDIVLFNPATRRCRKIPTSPYRPQSKSPYDERKSSYDYVGFGFDPVSNDYKIVTFDEINKPEFDDDHDNYDDEDVDDDDDGMSFDDEDDVYPHDQEEFDNDYLDVDDDDVLDDFDDDDVPDDVGVDVVLGDDAYFEGVHFKVGIYSLSTNCWRELECVIPDGKVSTNSIHYHSFYFNGSLHWLGGYNDNFASILVFDLNKETFKRFELPEIYMKEQVYLSVLTESLTMIVHNEFNYSLGVFEIWVMREYGVDESWRKLYNICPDVEKAKPLSFREVEFLIENKQGQLVFYNHITKVIKTLQVHGESHILHAFRYRESLVSLK